MKGNIILINGRKQTGKTTIGKYFRDYKNFGCIGFADELKKQLSYFMYKNLDMIEDDIMLFEKNKEKFINKTFADGTCINGRKMLQWYGEMMRKTFSESFWVDKVVDFINNTKYNIFNYIITDWRLKIEEKVIYKELGMFFNIYTVKIKKETIYIDNDQTEIEVNNIHDDYFDFIIDNNSTLNNLYKRCNEIYDYIMGNN